MPKEDPLPTEEEKDEFIDRLILATENTQRALSDVMAFISKERSSALSAVTSRKSLVLEPLPLVSIETRQVSNIEGLTLFEAVVNMPYSTGLFHQKKIRLKWENGMVSKFS